MSCLSTECEKYRQCRHAQEDGPGERWATFGSGTSTGTGMIIEYACGKNGGYAKYLPADNNQTAGLNRKGNADV